MGVRGCKHSSFSVASAGRNLHCACSRALQSCIPLRCRTAALCMLEAAHERARTFSRPWRAARGALHSVHCH